MLWKRKPTQKVGIWETLVGSVLNGGNSGQFFSANANRMLNIPLTNAIPNSPYLPNSGAVKGKAKYV